MLILESNKKSSHQIKKIESLKKGNQKISFVSGNFNIIHPGHLRLLNYAANCADYLVVAVNDDSQKGVLFGQTIRMEAINSLSNVDYVIALNGNLEDVLKLIQPDFVVKGNEHEDKFNVEQDLLKSFGGKIVFTSGDHSISEIDFLDGRRKLPYYPFNNIPFEYLKRHNINYGKICETIEKMEELNVCVFGDTIVDEYVTCEPLGLSQEDPTIVVNPVKSQTFLGGAAIVASHAAGLGANTHFFSVTGENDMTDIVMNGLRDNNVHAQIYQDNTRPTTLKKRYRTQGKTLLRVNTLKNHSISSELATTIYKESKDIISKADVLIFSDFSYGFLKQDLVDKIIKLCKLENVFMSADSQSSSQMGDISRFKGMDLISPTEREARLGVHDFQSGLITLCNSLQKKSDPKNIFITLNSEGMIISPNKEKYDLLTDRLPALNSSPVDISGAGDSLLVISSMALATGADVWTAAFLGSVAAGCQVGRLGNIPLKKEELLNKVNFLNT